jgi:hypothetical protein
MPKRVTKQPSDLDFAREHCIPAEGDTTSEQYPELSNLPGAPIYSLLPVVDRPGNPEFAFYKFDPATVDATTELFLANWNTLWEAAQSRRDVFSEHHRYADRISNRLSWIKTIPEGVNLYLFPDHGGIRYEVYASLYHLLPRRTLQRFGLPVLRRGLWPFFVHDPWTHLLLPEDFEEKLARAFATHLSPLIDSGSRRHAYSPTEPLAVLTHNLSFWLPFAYRVAESIMRTVDRVPFENEQHERRCKQLRESAPSGMRIETPRYGGPLCEESRKHGRQLRR